MFANHLWIAKPGASSSSSVMFQLGSEGKGGDGIEKFAIIELQTMVFAIIGLQT
jgi:hypothetical protein